MATEGNKQSGSEKRQSQQLTNSVTPNAAHADTEHGPGR